MNGGADNQHEVHSRQMNLDNYNICVSSQAVYFSIHLTQTQKFANTTTHSETITIDNRTVLLLVSLSGWIENKYPISDYHVIQS